MFRAIVDHVRDWLVSHDVTAHVDEGREALVAQDNYGPGTANRVVFVAAKDPIPLIPPTQMGEGEAEDGSARRQLANLMFAFDIHVAAFDPSGRDLAHRGAALDLAEKVVQGMHHAAWGLIEWRPWRWNDERTHGRHGAELVVSFAINLPLFDVADKIATPSPRLGQPKPVT